MDSDDYKGGVIKVTIEKIHDNIKKPDKKITGLEKEIKRSDIYGFLSRLEPEERIDAINSIYSSMQAFNLPMSRLCDLIYLHTQLPDDISEQFLMIEQAIYLIAQKQGLSLKDVIIDALVEGGMIDEGNQILTNAKHPDFDYLRGTISFLGFIDYPNSNKYNMLDDNHIKGKENKDMHGEKLWCHGIDKLYNLIVEYMNNNLDVSEEIEFEQSSHLGFRNIMDLKDLFEK